MKVHPVSPARYSAWRSSRRCHPATDGEGCGERTRVQIMVWSLRTGRLLDVLSGHEGPVYGLSFSPTAALLASSSWDRTVRTWDVFEAKGAVEPFQHTHDVLTVAYRPDGKQLCSSTLDGQLFFWEPHDGICQGSIEGRRDIAVRPQCTRASDSAGIVHTCRGLVLGIGVRVAPTHTLFSLRSLAR